MPSPSLCLPEKVLTPELKKLRADLASAPRRASTYKEIAQILIGMECSRLAARVLRDGLQQLPDDQGLLENLARAQQAAGMNLL